MKRGWFLMILWGQDRLSTNFVQSLEFKHLYNLYIHLCRFFSVCFLHGFTNIWPLEVLVPICRVHPCWGKCPFLQGRTAKVLRTVQWRLEETVVKWVWWDKYEKIWEIIAPIPWLSPSKIEIAEGLQSGDVQPRSWWRQVVIVYCGRCHWRQCF